MATSRIIWNGKPGEAYVNTTERFKYQLIVAYTNSCGFCIQYDRAISNWWPITFHFRCRCKQLLIKPGGGSTPFIDFRVKLSDLSEAQKVSAIGRSNYTLLGKGVVKWDDVVTETRVRSFHEIVQKHNLDLGALEQAGVRSDLARHAIEKINTPKQTLVREQRAKLIANIQKAGLSDAQIKEAVSVRIGEKIGIVGGKAAATVTEVSTRRSILPEPLRKALGYFGRKLRNLFSGPKTLGVAEAKTATPRARKVVPKPEVAPGRFATHAEVEEWAKAKFPNAYTLKIDGIPLESWHLIADEIDHLTGKFPEIAAKIQNFGADNAADYGNPSGIAWVSATGGSLKFDKKTWNKLGKLEKTFAESVAVGWNPAKTEKAGPKFYVTHEFGHLVDAHLQQTDREKYVSLHRQFKRENYNFDPAKGAQLSEYGATNEVEAVAEAFAAARWRTDRDNQIVNHFREAFGL